MFRRFSTIAIAAAMLLTASCTRENLVGNDPENDGMLKFCLSMSGSPASVLETKAASISTDDGMVSLPLSYERRDGIESRMPAAVPVTKGTQYNSAEQYEGSDSPAFSVVAWNSDGTPFIEDATEVTFTSNKWTPASSYKWEPEKDVKTFLAWANTPASGAGIENVLLEGNARQTFTYTVPTDARQQNDVMLGWYKGDGGKSMTAEITMVHPLTAIQFKQGEMDMSVTAIRSISIEGLLKTGEAAVTYASAGSKVTPSYSWTMGIATQTVTLAKKPEAESLEVDPVSSVIGEPFIVLPQKVLADKVNLSVVLSIGGTDRTLTAYLPAMDLKEGQTNVFTIGYAPYGEDALPGEFSVSATKKVRFARGNVQAVLGADKSVAKWQFAAHQYDFVGTTSGSGNLTMAEGSIVDLFGWSGSNKPVKWGISTSEEWSDYSGGNEQLTDWGLNYGDGSLWYTMPKLEWDYLFNNRNTKLKKTGVTVCGVTGCLVLAPDGFEGTIASSYDNAAWIEAEKKGLVCLPPAGYRISSTNLLTLGVYWTSTNGSADRTGSDVRIATPEFADDSRAFGRSVRLVTEVRQPAPKVKFIDLGLPSGTLWANMNIGATKPEESGEWFMWGEVKGHKADVTLPKDEYNYIDGAFTSDFASFDHSDARYKDSWSASNGFNSSNVPYHTGSSDNTGWSKYIPSDKTSYWSGVGSPDNKLVLDPEDDAAYVNWGGSSRMPTKAEFDELFDYTDNEWKSNYKGTGVNGYLFTNKTDESMSIFLPAVGLGGNVTLYNLNQECYYWSSSLDTEKPYAGCFRDFYEGNSDASEYSPKGRKHGRFVRAVKAKPIEFAVTGAVEMNHLATQGENMYNVTSTKPWKLQYTLNGTDWTDAVENTQIADWITFNKVSGTGTGSAETVTATVAAGTSTTITTDHNANLRGATAKGTEASPFDLSTHDIYGNLNAGGKVTTANCYVVSAPGWYSFPLVYGNAVKNGAVNTAAFAPTAAASSSTYLTPFVKADGYGITTPYIAGAASASVLWEDVADYAIISNTAADCKLVGSGTGTKVVFHVNQATLTPGNVVIAVKDASSKILWSWHIWVTDENLSCLTVTNYDGTFNKGVMPVNLGWVDLDSSKEGYEGKSLQIRFVEMDGDAISKTVLKTAKRVQYITSSEKGQSPTYQWGRKDPFIRAANITGNSELTKDSECCGAYIEKKSSALTFADIIKNPTWFMCINDNYNTNVGKYYNLWSANSTAYGNTANGYKEAPVKTVYDPCPPGFQVAQANAFTGFTTDGENYEKTPAKYNVVGNFNYGWTFYTKPNGEGTTIHFPVQGYRAFDSGDITRVTTNGYYWSAIQCATNRSYALYTVNITSGTNCVKPINTDNSFRSNGFPIRPVQE